MPWIYNPFTRKFDWTDPPPILTKEMVEAVLTNTITSHTHGGLFPYRSGYIIEPYPLSRLLNCFYTNDLDNFGFGTDNPQARLQIQGRCGLTEGTINSGAARFLMNVDYNYNPSIEMQAGTVASGQRGFAAYIDFVLTEQADYNYRIIAGVSPWPNCIQHLFDMPLIFKSIHYGNEILKLDPNDHSATIETLKVKTTTLVENLNADFLDGLHAGYFSLITHGHDYLWNTYTAAETLQAGDIVSFARNSGNADWVNKTIAGDDRPIGVCVQGCDPSRDTKIAWGGRVPVMYTSAPEKGAIAYVSDTLGQADWSQTTPVTNHWREIGHPTGASDYIEGRTLYYTQLHFN